MEKLVISAAVTGSLTTRDQNPNIPYTPQEIANAAIDCHRAGASVVHLHVRDPQTGRPVQDIELFRETIGLIREECDILINTSTGGGPGMTYDERIAIIPALSSDPQLKPDMASLNAGSVNFGMFNKRERTLVLDAVQTNPWSELLRFADTMTAQGVKPEIEIYEAGMINNAKVLLELEALKAPLHFQFVLGVLGGLQPTFENLVFLKNALPQESTWSLCSVGLSIFSLGAAAIAAGGNVRVGFEDCVYISRGEMAANNTQMVEKMVRMAKEMGREIATPSDTKKILSLSN